MHACIAASDRQIAQNTSGGGGGKQPQQPQQQTARLLLDAGQVRGLKGLPIYQVNRFTGWHLEAASVFCTQLHCIATPARQRKGNRLCSGLHGANAMLSPLGALGTFVFVVR